MKNVRFEQSEGMAERQARGTTICAPSEKLAVKLLEPNPLESV
jgi:hypothetical protein